MEPRRKHALLIIAIAFMLFMALTFYVVGNPVNDLDSAVTYFLQSRPWAKFLFTTNVIITSSMFRLSYLLLAALFIYKKRYSLLGLVLIAPLSELISSAIKNMVLRPRPTSDAFAIYDPTKGFSFVSGHTLEYAILFGVLGLVGTVNAGSRMKRYMTATISIIMSLVVGLGRVYTGAHWLTDVIGSYLIAAIVLLSVYAYADKSLTRRGF